MRLVIALLACAYASFAAADSIRFEPPAATRHTSVDATVSAVWPSICAPDHADVAIAGSAIAIHLKELRIEPCSELQQTFELTVHLGILAAGVYDVIADAPDGHIVARGTLTVRDTDTLHVSPYVVPATGGTTVSITNPFFLDLATSVTIDGVAVASQATPGPARSIVAPPHAPGAVDVTVSRGAESVTAKAALIYDDPASPDRNAFEPVLFPIAYEGAGAFGSRWTSDNFAVLAAGWKFRDRPPCSCSGGFPGISRLANDSSPWGLVLYALRGTIEKTTFVSRIRQTSGIGSAATEIPVVRERDFRAQTMYFVDLPPATGRRVQFRVWTLDEPETMLFVAGSGSVVIPMQKIPGAAMWFGSADVTSAIDERPSGSEQGNVATAGESEALAFRKVSPRAWGMLSITSNDTQQVTIMRAW